MNKLLFFCFCLYRLSASAQPSVYTTANAHSHNDYEQQRPFWEAYNHGFGSIEADIFFTDNDSELLVAHTIAELKTKRQRLDSLYLIPLVNCIKKNQGSPYADPTKKLQLLIDVKTMPYATLNKLIATIKRYPELTNNPLLQFAISGNRPASDSFTFYPSYIKFDGELDKIYSKKALEKIVLMSDDLKKCTAWNGKDSITGKDLIKIKATVARSHRLKKPVRFWDTPDNSNAWKELMRLQVDYLNTDHISLLTDYLNKAGKE